MLGAIPTNASPTKAAAALFAAMVCTLIAATVVGAQDVRAQDEGGAAPGSPREVFARYDIGPAQFSQLVDGSPISSGQEEILAKILLRFSRLGADRIHRWRKSDVSWSAVAAAVHQEQGELFAIRGRAKLVNEHALPAELAQRFEFAKYYSVQLSIDGSPHEAVVYARTVPQSWPIGTKIDEPTACDGLLLKLGPPEDGQQPLVFAAGRVGWLPESSPLARGGFDVSHFDAVRETNGQGLLAADREPFYQLLAAMGNVQPAEGEPAGAALDVVALLEEPADHHGGFFAVRGTARRIVKVAIDDAGVRERLGLDHYFEIDLFVPLGEAKLRFGESNKADENPIFENTFPVTLIARRLPPGLSEGENLHEQVAADAAFFKLWTYQSAYMARFNRVQPAPLLMIDEPRLVPAMTQDYWAGGGLVTAILIGLLVLTAAILWWYRAGDRRYQEQRRRRFRSDQPQPARDADSR